MNTQLMVMEPSGQSYGSYFVVDKVLHDEQSPFQRIFVFESKELGRVLMLDNIFNVSTRMEAYYHEPMAHIPMGMIPQASRILIIGGGDFGIARHLLKHEHIEHVTMCELDERVIDVCRIYFPEWASSCEQDDRFHLVIGDGCAYLKDSQPEEFDAIIVDSTDPFLHAPMLISEEFYNDAFRSLSSNGVFMQIIADFVLYQDAWKEIYPRVRNQFPHAKPIFVPIPFYATGEWGLLLAGKQEQTLDPKRCSHIYCESIDDLKTLTPEKIEGWLSLSPEMKTFFTSLHQHT